MIKLIDPSLFTEVEGRPHLRGSLCRICGEGHFPPRRRCAACRGEEVDVIALPREGSLWTWTVQRFPPTSPPFAGDTDNFRPFALGYVTLGDMVRVESRIIGCEAAALRFDMPVELALESIDGVGTTFAFRPLDAEAAR